MAKNPRSPFAKNTAPGGAGAPRVSAKGGNSSSGLIIGASVLLVALIGVFYFLSQSKEDKLNEIASIEAQNKKTQEENKARVEEHKRLVAKDKEEKQERMKAMAEEAAKKDAAAAQVQQSETPPAESTPDEPQSTTEETPTDTEEDTTAEDVDETADTPDTGEAVIELVLSPKADRDAKYAKRLTILAKRAAKSGGYADFAATLRDKLTEAYPEEMKGAQGGLGSTIRSGKLGERARCMYTSLTLAMDLPASVPDEDRQAFLKWLLTDKKGPAVAFAQSLAHYHIASRADAAEKMQAFQRVYKESPGSAFSKIKSIVDPVESINRKLYPYSKKELEASIAKLLETKPRGRASKEQQDAVNLVNVYRLISGVAPNVVHDPAYEKQATDAAGACKAKGTVSHNIGHSTDKCNLYPSSATPAATVTGYVQDPGGPNRKQKGHRRWILYPPMGKTGFGKVGGYQAMRAMDNSCSIRPKAAWSYPGRGYFPVRYLHSNGWSYYGSVPGSKVKVEMWSLPEGSLKRPPQSAQLSKENAVPVPSVFLNAGVSIVFEPNYDKMQKKDGKLTGAYWIRITWPNYRDEYVVEFY